MSFYWVVLNTKVDTNISKSRKWTQRKSSQVHSTQKWELCLDLTFSQVLPANRRNHSFDSLLSGVWLEFLHKRGKGSIKILCAKCLSQIKLCGNTQIKKFFRKISSRALVCLFNLNISICLLSPDKVSYFFRLSQYFASNLNCFVSSKISSAFLVQVVNENTYEINNWI